jgi:hypothetical protein
VIREGAYLGQCGMPTGKTATCNGRLIVYALVGQLAEAECDRCGATAARPAGHDSVSAAAGHDKPTDNAWPF